jgi:hypothetical protein
VTLMLDGHVLYSGPPAAFCSHGGWVSGCRDDHPQGRRLHPVDDVAVLALLLAKMIWDVVT